jgi:hypothetical protein
MNDSAPPIGRLGAALGKALPLQVCFSRAGYYVGTLDEQGPVSRESVEYWPTQTAADEALSSGCWTQRLTPGV